MGDTRLKRFRILIVDDEERILRFQTSKLKASGYDGLTALNGHEALERITSQQPDLVVLDLLLPKMHGADVLRELRSFSSVPVIILSALGADAERIKGLRLGMGLMLAAGMLVDNAVVVMESIYRRRQRGEGRLRAALKGAREVLAAVVCATATSIIVFLPLVLGGRTEISTWIGEVGRTIIVTLVCSMFLSLTAIPLAMARLLPEGASRPAPAVERLTALHQRVLRWTLAHRPATLALALAVVLTAVLPFSKVEKSPFTGTQVEAVHLEYKFTDDPSWREAERYVSRVDRPASPNASPAWRAARHRCAGRPRRGRGVEGSIHARRITTGCGDGWCRPDGRSEPDVAPMEPLNKSHGAATAALRDGWQGARRRP